MAASATAPGLPACHTSSIPVEKVSPSQRLELAGTEVDLVGVGALCIGCDDNGGTSDRRTCTVGLEADEA